MLLGLAWASQLASADDPVIGFRIDDSSDNARPAGMVTNSNGAAWAANQRKAWHPAAGPDRVAPRVAPDAVAAPEGPPIPHDCPGGPVAQLVRAADS